MEYHFSLPVGADQVWSFTVIFIILFVLYLLARSASVSGKDQSHKSRANRHRRSTGRKRQGRVHAVADAGGDNRKFMRFSVERHRVEITDNEGVVSGSVYNVSWFGIGLRDVARKIDLTAEKITVLLHGEETTLRLQGRLMWQSMEAGGEDVGVEVTDFPLEWHEFVASCAETG